MAAKTAAHKSKGRRHPAHASSFQRVADDLKNTLNRNQPVTATATMQAVIDALTREVKHLRKIVR